MITQRFRFTPTFRILARSSWPQSTSLVQELQPFRFAGAPVTSRCPMSLCASKIRAAGRGPRGGGLAGPGRFLRVLQVRMPGRGGLPRHPHQPLCAGATGREGKGRARASEEERDGAAAGGSGGMVKRF